MIYKKELGFGLMRLPRDLEGNIKLDISKKLVDFYISQGGSYFDTGYHYLNGLGETAIKLLLVNRHPRDKYRVTTKLPIWLSPQTFNEMQDIFNEQLERSGLTFFDCYLLHGINDAVIPWIDKTNVFQFLQQLKDNQLVKKIGFSFHGSPKSLTYLLEKYNTYIDVVQIQYNYLDQINPLVQSKENYQICEKFNKEVMVMEPCKGGILFNLSQADEEKLKNFNSSPIGFALNYAATPKNVSIVLSGMTTIRQVFENMQIFKNFQPLDNKQILLAKEIAENIWKNNFVQCTQCGYCLMECSKKINIPLLLNKYGSIQVMSPNEILNVLNHNYQDLKQSNFDFCIKCQKCEKICPQHLKISEYISNIKNNQVLKYELRLK